MKIRIIDLNSGEEERIRAIGAMLVDGFQENSPEAYPDLETAVAEVLDWFTAGRLSRVAIDDEGGETVGWIGGSRHYNSSLPDPRKEERQGVSLRLSLNQLETNNASRDGAGAR